jgi:tetratricopeptide (TPR) repeat protein
MTAKWLPVESGIVPRADPSGPMQEEERFAALQRALEDARGEHRLRRFDAAEAILDRVIQTAESLLELRFVLLTASAYSLKGRIHWRRAERASEYQYGILADEERARQEAAFRKAISLFKIHESMITADMPESRLYTDYAIALFRTGNTDAAISMLQRAQATGVMAADAFAYLGLAYLKRDDPEQAMLALKKGLQLAPGDKILLETLAETHEKAGESGKAVGTYCKAAIAAGKDDDVVTAQKLLQTALKIKPDDAQALSMLTLLLRSQGNDIAAKNLLDATLNTFKTNAWALGLRAMMLSEQGSIDAALADFRQAHVDSPDLAWVLLEYAKTIGASDQSSARKLLRQAATLIGKDDPRVAQAKVQLQVQVALAGVAGVTRKIVDLLRIAAGKAADNPVVRSVVDQAGLTALFERLLKSADSELEQAALLENIVKDWPNRAEPREALARVLLSQGQYKKAINQVDEALRDEPDSANLLLLKAKALDLNGEISEAVRFYRRASRVTPEGDEAFGALLDALTRANRSEEALNEVEHRLALFPSKGPALAHKGHLLYAAGRFNEAAEALKDAEPLVRGDARFNACLQLAQALWNIDRFSEALEAFERAAKNDNVLGDAHAHMAVMLIEVADYSQAAAVLERAIARISADIGDQSAKTRLAWLWSTRGFALRSGGLVQADQLKPIFETATMLDPDNAYAKMRLGWTLLQEPDGQAKGDQLIRKLIEDRARIDVPAELMGWCHYTLKQYEEAEYWLRDIVLRDPSDLTTRFDLALVLLAMNSGDAEKEYADTSSHARKKAPERRRGLFHIAIVDLIGAAKAGRLNEPTRARSIWQGLWNDLKKAGVRDVELARLQYPTVD